MQEEKSPVIAKQNTNMIWHARPMVHRSDYFAEM